jgi:ADP-L-glycero-D-manno-heptose 6-epimerase
MILITGSNGFIGSNYLKTLDQPTYLIPNHIDLSIVPWDQIRYVYHFGAISNTTETDIDLIYKSNIKFTNDLFVYCMRYDIGITYASSASVYGNSTKYEINPLNYYAMSKAMIDYKASEMISKGLNVVGLRFYNVYGNGEENKLNQASTIHQFTKQAKTDNIIKVFKGSGNFFRDFVWVGDVIDCVNTKMPNGIYDVGTSKPVTFLSIAEEVAKKYNADILEIPMPPCLEGKYQHYTCAQSHFNKKFISVKDYLWSQLDPM